MNLKVFKISKRWAAAGLALLMAAGVALPAGSEQKAHAAAGTTDLYFSEYIEGSSYNKALEIFNGTGKTIDLIGYTIVQFNNGGSQTGGTAYALQLSGTVASGDAYVIANSRASQTILNAADNITSSNVVNFNGDDAIVLFKNYDSVTRQGTIVDSIGAIGTDPGTAWSGNKVSTLDQTLVRKSSIVIGDSNGFDAFDPSVEWTSLGKDVFSNLGGHTMDGFDGGNGDTGGDTGTELKAISEAKALQGQKVTIEGVVTADNSAIGGGKLSTYVQDATGGINVFAVDASAFPALTEGRLVEVKGTVTSYKGLTEIAPDTITVKAENQPVPAPLKLSLLEASKTATAEPNEGRLVTVRGFVADVPATVSGGGYNVPIIDEQFNGMTLRVMAETNAIGQLKAGTWYDFTGILSQYNSYQLLPRKAADVTELNPQLPAPTPESSYTSTVASVVDGDTIHLAAPVLGVTKVRFLSIDTPEKNYEGQSQGFYAEAAAAKLAELLPVGTEVEIEPGQDPIDGYGRLLAHVYVKSTGLDVNKEMVRTGYAVNYFIWPNMNHFEEYSAAAKEAIENGYGMHNPQNPIEKLPYQFRFELRGGPDKYVGDYFTKTYVTPDKWREIPTENRVFFFTEQDAKAAGYAPASAQQTVSVQLLSVNDLHGKIDVTETLDGVKYGRIDYTAAYLKQREAANPNTLIVHAGDMVGGLVSGIRAVPRRADGGNYGRDRIRCRYGRKP